ncbi:hypothetical protein [Paenibacillus agaridevorans]|nr:hypothetical protein [Paenibacillus agaridevorans]
MQKLMPPLVRIEDVKIEQMLRGGGESPRSQGEMGRRKEGWSRLVLLSACLAVHDVCVVPRQERTEALVEEACLRSFSNRHQQFHSGEHYLQTRCDIIRHLQRFMVQDSCDGEVMARFESFTVYVEELDMELTQQFHLITVQDQADGEGGYIVQKLVADENPESLELYFHMTVVFGMCAFGRLPSRVEALVPLSGRRFTWKPEWQQWQKSLDYMRLVKSMLESSEATSGSRHALPAM